jgi:hypothetical protein
MLLCIRDYYSFVKCKDFICNRAGEAMFIFKRDKLKENKETVTGNPSKRQKGKCRKLYWAGRGL